MPGRALERKLISSYFHTADITKLKIFLPLARIKGFPASY